MGCVIRSSNSKRKYRYVKGYNVTVSINPQHPSMQHQKEAEKTVTTSALHRNLPGNPVCNIKRLSKLDPRFAHQPKYVFTEETTEYLKQPSFNNWQWEENEMASLLEHMFFELGVVEAFKIDLPTLKRFLRCVKDNYNLNPFHNFRHCFCVTQMVKTYSTSMHE